MGYAINNTDISDNADIRLVTAPASKTRVDKRFSQAIKLNLDNVRKVKLAPIKKEI